MDSRSLVSGEIWLGDSLGESTGFTRDVKIGGWTSVGDKLGGAYVGALSLNPCRLVRASLNSARQCMIVRCRQKRFVGVIFVIVRFGFICGQGTTFHILKRYSDFEQLSLSLRRTLPVCKLFIFFFRRLHTL